jgi:excisionase family DNA binding protein
MTTLSTSPEHIPERVGQTQFVPQGTLQIYSTKEAARLLGISHRTLEEWRARGIGPRFFKMGRMVRYRLAELNRFVNRRDFGNTAEAEAA